MFCGHRIRAATFMLSAWTALGTESCESRVAQCVVRLHLLVERGGGKSTRDLQIFRITYHPGSTFWRPVARPSPYSRTVRPEFDKSSKNFFFFRTSELRLAPGQLILDFERITTEEAAPLIAVFDEWAQ